MFGKPGLTKELGQIHINARVKGKIYEKDFPFLVSRFWV